MDSKTTLISADEWYKVDKDVKAKNCIVRNGAGREVINIIENEDIVSPANFTHTVVFTDRQGSCMPLTRFTVEWLQPDAGSAVLAQAATAPAEDGGAEDDPLVIKYGDGYAAGYADGRKDTEAQPTALTDYVVKSFEAYNRAFETDISKMPTPGLVIHWWEEGVKKLFTELKAAREREAALVGELSITREALMEIRSLTQNSKIEQLVNSALEPQPVGDDD